MNRYSSKGIAVVLARSGSKGLVDKNIRYLAGVPLILHTLRPLSDSCYITKIIVSTDGPSIKKTVEEARVAKVEVHDRPREFAGDTVTTKQTLKHVFDTLPPDDKSCDFLYICR